MKRPVFIGLAVLFVVFIVFAGFKIANHQKYANVYEEIYSISKTKYASSSTVFDKEKDAIETKYEDVKEIDEMRVKYNFSDIDGGFVVELFNEDSVYTVRYNASDKVLYESFTGDESKEAELKEVFKREFLEDWFNTRASRFSMDNLGDVEVINE
ncbi:hypothetical protein [Nosocomiicoccus massiliensis]|uniref:hypothetical protein n=1 Tax=Nosocomiicoccus massiliensis TaxID=1232430 RepID=UPI00041AE811|nr:hypothetical protein [Nosocomiicoccus massiliensis]